MNRQDRKKNAYMLDGTLARKGFVRWFHAFKGINPNTGEVRSFFIEYQIINPGLGGDEPVLGQHPRNQKADRKPSYALIKAGILPDGADDGLQLNHFYPINGINFCREPFVLQIEDCFYSENHIYGSVEVSGKEASFPYMMSDEGTMEWDLDIHKAVACNMGFVTSPIACALGALSGFWHAEGMKTYYKGQIAVNGEVYHVDPTTCYGFADKNWGKRADRPILLLSSSHLISMTRNKEYKNSAFAVKGCFPKLFFLPLKRKIMIQLTHMGEDFEFHFASIRNLSRCRWNTKETNKRYIWHIKAQNKDAVIKISVNCTKDRLMELLYENTEGTLSESPILCGMDSIGKIELYQKSRGSLKLIDTLAIEDGLCTYSR